MLRSAGTTEIVVAGVGRGALLPAEISSPRAGPSRAQEVIYG
jgi:hypothetical protein